jgi:2'-5' RNA ligase
MPDHVPLRRDNRLFVALELGEDLRATLADVGSALEAGGAAKAVPARNLHVTLAFLGRVAPDTAPSLADDVVAALGGPAGRVRPARVVARPRASAARLVAVELEDLDGAVAAAAARIRAAVGHVSDGSDDRRPFWPHVTVARFRRPERVRGFPDIDGEHVFDITRASLYDSFITPGRPPRYEALVTVTLGGSLAERSSSHG